MSEYSRRRGNHFNNASLPFLAGLVLAGIAGFALAAFSLNQTVTESLWRPDLGTYSHRLAALQQHKAEVDTLFLGSSHAQYGILPAEFDATAAKLGRPPSSYLLSVRGMTIPWVLHTLEELRRIDFPNLQRMFLEPGISPLPDLNLDTRWKNASSLRSRYISSLDHTIIMARVLWSSNVSARRKIVSSVHLTHNFALNLVNLGVLADITIAWPLNQDSVDEEWRKRGSNSGAEGAISANLKLVAPPANAGYRAISETEVATLGDYVVGMEELGAQPYMVFIPGRDEPGLRKAVWQVLSDNYRDVGVIGELDFAQATGAYSRTDLWWDTDHLNRRGAELFSRDLAAQWVNGSSD
jgi:hypothetical protein